MKLIWNVYAEDINRLEIRVVNIFDHAGFRAECEKLARKRVINFDEFSNGVHSALAYYFWSKSEWEIVLTGWLSADRCREKKIDVFSQVELNWDAFIHWLWEQRSVLKRGSITRQGE